MSRLFIQLPMAVEGTWSDGYRDSIREVFGRKNVFFLPEWTTGIKSAREMKGYTALAMNLMDYGALTAKAVAGLRATDTVLMFEPFALAERMPYVTKAKVAVYLHQVEGTYYGRTGGAQVLNQAIADSVDRLYVPSIAAHDKLQQRCIRSKVVGGFVPISARHRPAKRPRSMVWAGRVCKDKGIDTLKKVAKYFDDVRILSTQVEDKAAAKGLRIERLNREGYLKALRESAYFLVTSRVDTFNVAMVEAIANGCVVLAPDSPLFREMLPHSNLYSWPGEIAEMLTYDTAVIVDPRRFDPVHTARRIMEDLDL